MEANPVISGNVLQRVLFIRNGDQVGTAFTIEIDERQYLITARHLVPPESNPLLIDVFSNGQWSRVNVTTILIVPDDVDISVLAAPIQLTPTPPINVDGSCHLSEQVYFLGFPYGLKMDEDNATSINNGLPLPFVKHAIISTFEGLGLSNRYLLDGFNNPGFSGGPVVRGGQNPNQMTIIAVVSARHLIQEPVVVAGRPSAMTVPISTGIMVAYPINRAVEAIRQHPIGFVVK